MLAPFGRDAELACRLLSQAGLACRLCRGIDDLQRQPAESCGAILLTEEVLAESAIRVLSALLDTQPAWSSLPVVVFMGRKNRRPELTERSLPEALGLRRGIILLERPIRVASFVSVMRSAVLTRRRQYELRDQLAARQQAEAHAQMLAEEMKHRIKNSLAMIGALASQTFRHGRPVQEALDMFSARLRSMALAQDVLTQSNHDGADLHQLISRALEPHRDQGNPDRIAIDEPQVWISGRRTTALTMAMHELATNAVKYGALSVGSGRVSVRWHIEEVPGTRQLLIEWREHGGPPVAAPKRRGFGSTLVERGLATELDGHARILFEPEGVVCEIRASLNGALLSAGLTEVATARD